MIKINRQIAHSTFALLFIFVFVFLYTTTVTAIESTISASTQESVHKTLLSSLQNNKQPKDIHYSLVSLLKLPFKKEESKKAIDSAQSSLCAALKLDNEKHIAQLSLNDLYNTIASVSALKCSIDSKATESLESRLKSLLTSVTSVEQVYDAVRSIFLFRKQFKTVASDQKILNSLFDKIHSHFNEQKSAFCSSSDSDDICIRNTGFALEALTLLNTLLNNTKLSSIVTYVRQISGLVQLVNDKTSLRSASTLARGLNKLGSIVPLEKKIESKDFDALAQFFVNYASSQLKSVSNIYDFVEGATSVASSPAYTPTYVNLTRRDDKNSVFAVEVKNIFGAAATDKALKVVLTSLYTGNNAKDSKLIKPVTFTKESDTTFVWDATKTKIFDTVGSYNFDLDIQPLQIKVTQSYKSFAGSVSIEDLTLTGKGIPTQTAKFGEKFDTVSIQVGAQTRVIVSFKLVGSVNPHQVFIRLVDDKANDYVYVAKASGSTYRADINLNNFGEAVDFVSSVYNAQILVGDASLKEPIQWTFGSLSLTFTSIPELTEEQQLYAPRKTITHVFADPAKRAPETTSTLFSAIVVVPLGLFLISLLRVGFNFNLYPGGISSILALVFIGLLAAMLYVLARFFIDVTFFPTLYQLCALGVATILVGTKVLSSVAEKRTLTQSQ